MWNCDNLGQPFKSKFYQYFAFVKKKKIFHGFVSFCISLTFTYCLFVENVGDDQTFFS